MKKYEIMYIIRPTVEEESRKALVEEISNIFTNLQSTVTKVTEWGMRDFAYEIVDYRKGYYVLLNVEATPEAIAEFNRVANIKEDIIRNIVVAE
jgi:small subunit ribosomal protein S6